MKIQTENRERSKENESIADDWVIKGKYNVAVCWYLKAILEELRN